MTADRPRSPGEEIANSISHGLCQLLYGASVMHHTMTLNQAKRVFKVLDHGASDLHWLYAPLVCHFILVFGYEA